MYVIEIIVWIIKWVFTNLLIFSMYDYLFIVPITVLIIDIRKQLHNKKHMKYELLAFVLTAVITYLLYIQMYVNAYTTMTNMTGIISLDTQSYLFDYSYAFPFFSFVTIGFFSYIILKYYRKDIDQGGFYDKKMSKLTQGILLGGIYPAIVVTFIYMGYLCSTTDVEYLRDNMSFEDYLSLPLLFLITVQNTMQIISVWFLVSVGRLFWKMKKEGTSGKVFLLGVGIALILIAVILGIGMLFGQGPDSIFLFFSQSENS